MSTSRGAPCLFVPESWTHATGINEHTYHLFSLCGSTAAGVLTAAGILLLRTQGAMDWRQL